MGDMIIARKYTNGEYRYSSQRDAWEFEDPDTHETWWVTDMAMVACMNDRCDGFQSEGYDAVEAQRLAYEASHGEAWGKDEWASIHGVYSEEGEEGEEEERIRYLRSRYPDA